MKLAVPMAVAWYLQKRSLPPSLKYTLACLCIIFCRLFDRQTARFGHQHLGLRCRFFCAAVGGIVVALGALGGVCDVRRSAADLAVRA